MLVVLSVSLLLVGALARPGAHYRGSGAMMDVRKHHWKHNEIRKEAQCGYEVRDLTFLMWD